MNDEQLGGLGSEADDVLHRAKEELRAVRESKEVVEGLRLSIEVANGGLDSSIFFFFFPIRFCACERKQK